MARNQPEGDVLFEVRNGFYIGNYQQAINDAQKLRIPSTELTLERDILVYRSYLAQNKFRVVLDEISGSSPPELRPLKTLADYLSNKDKRSALVSALDEQITVDSNLNNHTFVIVAATIYSHERNFENVLKVLRCDDHLENLAMNLQTYLRMDRVDLAKKELKTMQEKDEDNTLCQLAQASLNVAMGGEKLQEAYYIVQELIEKYGSTPLLLNLQSCALIGQGKHEEAESILMDALAKDPNNPDALLNMMVVTQHLGKSMKVAKRYETQLRESNPDHHFVIEFRNKANEFDALAKNFSLF